MFTTPEKVLELTGYNVTGDLVAQAQGIVEAYVGRVEGEITNTNDLSLLENATAYQAAYMQNNWARTFEQVALSQILQGSNMMTFRQGDKFSPWVAPLAIIAAQRLTWMRSRSIRTGRIFKKISSRWDQR